MIARALAGALLGFPLSGLLLALLMALTPAQGQGWLIPALILFFPLWTGMIAGSFMFRSPLRAWLALGGANLIAFALLAGVRSLHG